MPAGSLFDSLYDGLTVEGAAAVAAVAGPVMQTAPEAGCGVAVEGLMQMWQESIENEKLILELAGAVELNMSNGDKG